MTPLTRKTSSLSSSLPGADHVVRGAGRRWLRIAMSPRRLFTELQPGVAPFPWTKMRVLGTIPVVIVLFIFAGAYFAAVPCSLIPAMGSMPLFTSLLLLVYNAVFLLALASFLLTVYADPGEPPPHFRMPKIPHQRLPPQPGSPLFDPNAVMPPPTRSIPDFLKDQWERTYAGDRRYCPHCLGYKPDRTHHCRQCGRCILRMDHHCVFVNNCVGFLNYKFFVLFLFYAWLGCALTTLFAGPNFAAILTRGKLLSSGFPVERIVRKLASLWEGPTPTLSISLAAVTGMATAASKAHPQPLMGQKEVVFVLGYVMASAFTFALSIFNLFHLWLLLKNRTTIEQYETSDPLRLARIESYNLGTLDNLRAALGKDLWTWPLPIRLSIPGDGVHHGAVRSSSRDEEAESRNLLVENQIDV